MQTSTIALIFGYLICGCVTIRDCVKEINNGSNAIRTTLDLSKIISVLICFAVSLNGILNENLGCVIISGIILAVLWGISIQKEEISET